MIEILSLIMSITLIVLAGAFVFMLLSVGWFYLFQKGGELEAENEALKTELRKERTDRLLEMFDADKITADQCNQSLVDLTLLTGGDNA